MLDRNHPSQTRNRSQKWLLDPNLKSRHLSRTIRALPLKLDANGPIRVDAQKLDVPAIRDECRSDTVELGLHGISERVSGGHDRGIGNPASSL